MIREHNLITGEIIDREMNAEELLQWEANKETVAQRLANESAKAAARQAILDRLGLTADEAALLLGAN
jgi:hypothetical protein